MIDHQHNTSETNNSLLAEAQNHLTKNAKIIFNQFKIVVNQSIYHIPQLDSHIICTHPTSWLRKTIFFCT